MTDSQTKSRLEIIKSYFKRVDERDPTFLDIFTDNVEFFSRSSAQHVEKLR
jgi:hypothetical protein